MNDKDHVFDHYMNVQNNILFTCTRYGHKQTSRNTRKQYKITDYLGSPLTIPSDWICLRRPTRPVDGTWAWRMEDDGQALRLGSLVDRFRVDDDPPPKMVEKLRTYFYDFLL